MVIFHSYVSSPEGNPPLPLVRCRRSDFAEVLRQQPVTAAESEALRFDKILGVDKAGPDVALIKLQRLGGGIMGEIRHFSGENHGQSWEISRYIYIYIIYIYIYNITFLAA